MIVDVEQRAQDVAARTVRRRGDLDYTRANHLCRIEQQIVGPGGWWEPGAGRGLVHSDCGKRARR